MKAVIKIKEISVSSEVKKIGRPHHARYPKSREQFILDLERVGPVELAREWDVPKKSIFNWMADFSIEKVIKYQ